MIKHGSMMINAVSNSTVPHISLLIGASYGAGHYGMCGRAYDPRFLFAWPSAKSAVMGGTQLAGVLSIVSRAAAQARGQQVDEDADAALRAAVEAQIEAESLPMFLSGRLYDDGVIDPETPGPCSECACPRLPAARSRGRRTSASSGCRESADDHQGPGCQSRRDQPAGFRHVPPTRHRHRRDLHRSRCPRRTCAGRRCPRPGGQLPRHRRHPGRGPGRRCRCRPSRIRISLGECGIRRGGAGRRVDLDRAAGGSDRRDGVKVESRR